MSRYYVYNLNALRASSQFGNKANNLCLLSKKGYKIPQTFVCVWKAYLEYRSGNKSVIKKIRYELDKYLKDDFSYAVRSSANIEDDSKSSFAGMFKTFLNIRGKDNIVVAIRKIWDSVNSDSLSKYLIDRKISSETLKMAVIIQEMVRPFISGVSFSKNPLTGLSDIIVEAVKGSGEKLLQEGVTPKRWVNKWGRYIEKPDDAEVPLDLIDEVIEFTLKLEKEYRHPVDIEWVFDGEKIYLVQIRKMKPVEVNVYSNKISREVLPGIIKPLVWSINVPVVNGAWVTLLERITGLKGIEPSKLSKQFYYRAYFDMKTFSRIFTLFGLPPESLELLMGIESQGQEKPKMRPGFRTILLLPRMVVFIFTLINMTKKLKSFINRMKIKYIELEKKEIGSLDEKGSLEYIERLFHLNQKTAYYNIIIPLLSMVYNRMLQKMLRDMNIDYKTIELDKNKKELLDYSPTLHLGRLKRLFKEKDKSKYKKELEKFIHRFGHFSDSGNDFSIAPWREDREIVEKMIKNYEEKLTDEKKKGLDEIKLSLFKRFSFNLVYRLASRYFINREAISSFYTYGYGRFRDYFIHLGGLLKEGGQIDSTEDIFYLYLEEIREIVYENNNKDWKIIIDNRKKDIENSRYFTVPDIIYGDRALPVENVKSDRLNGIPTSHGIYTGPVKVLKGIRDMGRIKKGDIIIIPYSDVGWTPLFGKAGAVISESGGILSHSSILAREYKIPAVLSVNNACNISENTIVTVDGFKGEIYIHHGNNK